MHTIIKCDFNKIEIQKCLPVIVFGVAKAIKNFFFLNMRKKLTKNF